jgi:ATP-dependent DNA helicase RecQ
LQVARLAAEEKARVLRERFGYAAFRPGQEEAIDAILAGRDVLAVMPTGAGKSLCYQIPAMLLPGTTVVVSPLIALMKDQVQSLRAAGVPAAFLNSSLSPAEYNRTMEQVSGGGVKLLYIAPERLQRADIVSLIDSGGPGGRGEVPLVVIDEAHCVSQWGHDFRPSYLDIAGFIAGFRVRPVTAAFTATATPKVRENISELLRLKPDALVITSGFDRPNLCFEVQKPHDKTAALLACLEKRKGSSGIVYCATRKAVEEIHALLAGRGYSAARYHAGLEDAERRRNQDEFLCDRKTVMIATNAFGMGIDKPNVSFVIHYNMPKNIESYYQEAGRAGRDGEKADCVLLYSGQDVRINDYLITHSEDAGNSGEEPDPALLAHNRELLRQMTFYATGLGCLRRKLLSYFGEAAPAYCGNCSGCLAEYEEADITPEARNIISCVYRLRERGKAFGRMMIIDILRGSKNEKALRFGFDKLSVWGVMAETGVHRLRVILDRLIDEGWLNLEGEEYPVVTLGSGPEMLREGKKIFMKLPAERREEGPRAGGAPAGKPGKAPAQKEDALDFDEGLFERLRGLRKEIAEKEKRPAFAVFSDASLMDMCRRKPAGLAQFSAVSGVGPVKLQKYGEAFTGLIGAYLRAP